MKSLIVALFFIMIIAQWFVPLSMVVEQENVLTNGRLFKFKTEPIDPSDPFRGKYITLRFAESTFLAEQSMEFQSGEDVYVEIKENEYGFAIIQSVSCNTPVNSLSIVKAKVGYADSGGSVDIQYPFDKFYLEESKAADAERAYWEANSDSTQVAYALVAIKNGTAALKDVIINEKSVVDLVKEMNEDEQ